MERRSGLHRFSDSGLTRNMDESVMWSLTSLSTVTCVDAPGHTPDTRPRIPEHRWIEFDVVLAAVLFLASLRTILRQTSDPIGTSWDVVRMVAAGIACGALPFRRRHPTFMLAVVAAAVAVLVLLGEHGAAEAAIGFAIYSLAATSTQRVSPTLVGGLVGLVLLAALVAPNGVSLPAVIAGPAIVLVGWLAGENVRTQRAHERDAAERALEREREREARARQAATQERVLIARELHDVVAHSMSLIAVWAGAARLVSDTDPDETRDALAIIETTSREALREMRRLVGVLREPGESAGHLEPAPGLRDVAELVSRVEQTGTHVDLHIEGDQRPQAPGVDVSAFRIVQEAITNVVRHAGPTSAHVWLRYRPDELEIEVTDDGGTIAHLDSPPRAGHGLIGMRERVALYGGELTAGPFGNGFRVYARLPTHDGRA
jgi:signal transduction histidine kinase